MAAALLNKLADPRAARAISAGTEPGQRVHPEVVSAMREIGIDLEGLQPQPLTPELARQAQVLVTMGCGDKCPFVPGARIEDWPLQDPKGQPVHVVRAIRDEIERRVRDLIDRDNLARRR
jgi:protein-tyrosine-phosphatase